MGSNFRSIALWKESQSFAERVAEVVIRLTRDRATDAIASQLMRAPGSIPANVAEGYGRFSQAAYRHHLSIARGSAFEAESWIDLLYRRHYLSDDLAGELLTQCSKVESMITTRMRELGEAKQTYARERASSMKSELPCQIARLPDCLHSCAAVAL